jgi:hypothetical protein
VGSGFALKSSCPTVTGVGCRAASALTVSRKMLTCSSDRNRDFTMAIDLQCLKRALKKVARCTIARRTVARRTVARSTGNSAAIS